MLQSHYLAMISLISLATLIAPVLSDVYNMSQYNYQTYPYERKSSIASNDYHLTDHPIFALPQFANIKATVRPVIMKKYYLNHKQLGPRSALHSIYVPRVATYVHHDSGDVFVKDADAFVPGPHFPSSDPKWDAKAFGKIYLNSHARVFALLESFRNFYHPPPQNFYPSMTNMPDGWRVVGAVRTPDGNDVILGDLSRWGNSPRKLLPRVLAVEVVVNAETVDGVTDYVVRFPHPNYMMMNGDIVRSIDFLIVPEQADGTVVNLNSFPVPVQPPSFKPLRVDGERLGSGDGKAFDRTDGLVHPDRDPALPNQNCPDWLHNMYVTKSQRRWSRSKLQRREPQYWRTWHPTIDPVFWCYFDHEHGSFPGRTYLPTFGYTAWNTPDKTTADGRQSESHRGFKIFYLPLEADRAAVFTVHMHASQARRFSTRHHTISFAVLRGHPARRQKVEMELSFKADFGPAMGQSNHRIAVPLTDEDRQINSELEREKRRAARNFNVLNVDKNFPDSLDRSFRIKGDISRGPDGVLDGMYEQWQATFPSCTAPVNRKEGAFLFDIRDPATAVRLPGQTTDENIQWLNGVSLRRMIIIHHHDITMSLKHCMPRVRSIVRRRKGVFYTDPFFKRIFYQGGRNRVRQFIKRRFVELKFPLGFIRANDPWSGIYAFNGSPGLQYLEKGISGSLN